MDVFNNDYDEYKLKADWNMKDRSAAKIENKLSALNEAFLP